MEIGKNIKDYRKLREITQTKLADSIGMSLRTIQKYESEEISISIDTLKDISKALDVHIINLLGLEKEHKSIAKLTANVKVDMTELDIARAKLDQIKVLINEINNMEIKIDVQTKVRR